MKGDLHVHTTASDGLLSPERMVEEAFKRGLSFIAITDHDTVAGVERAVKAGKELGLTVIPGIELNTDYNGTEMHVLGYFIDISQQWFQRLLSDITNVRANRAQMLLANLKRYYNMDIPWELVKSIAGNAAVGRPHIARAMMQLGYVRDMAEAFNNYISPNSPAYVPRYKMTPEEGIGYIKKLGGVAVAAHPGLLADKHGIFHAIRCGVDGLEVYHTMHHHKDSEYLEAIADDYELIATGGSDCHGDLINGELTLGKVAVSEDILDKLEDVHIKRYKLA